MTRPPFPAVLDNTIMTTFRSCPRKFELQYLHHWKPQSRNVHLHAGAAFAQGLEVARRAFWEHNLPVEQAYALGLAALVEAYGDFECPADSAKSLERMCQALEYYFAVWPLDTDPAQPELFPTGRRGIEFSFVQPLPIAHPETGEPLLYSGRADMICRLEQGLFIEDDKTTSSLGASWANQWDLRSQFTGYCWAARESQIPVDGVLIRGVAILKTKFDHQPYITYRAEWEIERWLDQTTRDIRRMIAAWSEGHWDYNLADACGEFGGCLFRQVCKHNQPDEWLPMYFAQRRWDPVTRTELPLEGASA